MTDPIQPKKCQDFDELSTILNNCIHLGKKGYERIKIGGVEGNPIPEVVKKRGFWNNLIHFFHTPKALKDKNVIPFLQNFVELNKELSLPNDEQLTGFSHDEYQQYHANAEICKLALKTLASHYKKHKTLSDKFENWASDIERKELACKAAVFFALWPPKTEGDDTADIQEEVDHADFEEEKTNHEEKVKNLTAKIDAKKIERDDHQADLEQQKQEVIEQIKPQASQALRKAQIEVTKIKAATEEELARIEEEQAEQQKVALQGLSTREVRNALFDKGVGRKICLACEDDELYVPRTEIERHPLLKAQLALKDREACSSNKKDKGKEKVGQEVRLKRDMIKLDYDVDIVALALELMRTPRILETECSKIKPENALALYSFAHQYGLTPLQQACERFLIRQGHDLESALNIYDSLQGPALQNSCVLSQHVFNHMLQNIQHKEVIERILKLTQLELYEYFLLNNLAVSEFDLMTLCLRWSFANSEPPHTAFELLNEPISDSLSFSILQCFDYTQLDQAQINTLSKHSDEMQVFLSSKIPQADAPQSSGILKPAIELYGKSRGFSWHVRDDDDKKIVQFRIPFAALKNQASFESSPFALVHQDDETDSMTYYKLVLAWTDQNCYECYLEQIEKEYCEKDNTFMVSMEHHDQTLFGSSASRSLYPLITLSPYYGWSLEQLKAFCHQDIFSFHFTLKIVKQG